jgi:predicted outer membrane repeat protein
MTGTQFISNSAGSRGGGAFASSALLNGGSFQNDTCWTGGCRGGGLMVVNTVDLTATQFISNSSAGNGGGVHAGNGRLVNALFARNSAAANGAAIFLDGVGVSTILHNTIAGPTLTSAGAIHVTAGTVGITNTLVASHSVGIVQTAGTVTEDYNLFFNTPAATLGGVTSGGHSFSGNPAFAGPVLDDYHLGAGSAAIDQGVNAGVASDVDGEPRPLYAGFVIGFDEFALRVLYLPLLRR